MHNGSSLDSLFIKITDVSTSNKHNLELQVFDNNLSGRTDGIISPICQEVTQMNYCNIQLKTVLKSKYEESENINTTSKADELTAQSLAELLASIRFSECPTMQFTTDLDQNFQIMFLTQEKDDKVIFNHYKLSGTDAIAAISMWLLYFCPHRDIKKILKPKTTDLKLLADIQRAYQNIKEMMESVPQIIEQDSELASVVEDKPLCLGTEEDNQSKCQKWVDSII